MDQLIYLREKFVSLNKITREIEIAMNDNLANDEKNNKKLRKKSATKQLMDLGEEQGDQEQKKLNDIDAKELVYYFVYSQ